MCSQSGCARTLNPHHTPIGRPRRKPQIHQPSGAAHRADLDVAEAPLQGCAEAVARVSAKGVEAAVGLVAQGEGGHGQAGGFCCGSEVGEGPVDAEGEQVGNELLGSGRKAADQQAGGVGEAPEPAEPAGAVVECVIEVEQQRRVGFKQLCAGADGGRRWNTPRPGFGWAPLGSCRASRRDEWPGPLVPNGAP